MYKNPRIFIGTLYSGEGELDDCIASIKMQKYSNWEHRIFRNMTNVEAHQAIYNAFMAHAGEFDIFIKLDADMVFDRPTALEEIIWTFRSNANLDSVFFSVKDWFGNIDIIGMGAFSSRVKWDILDDDLFVDPRPTIPGIHMVVRDWPSPIALHMPNSSLQQAYAYGYHRALKVTQRGKDLSKKRPSKAYSQLKLLFRIWEEFLKTKNELRGAVLLGAEDAFLHHEKSLDDKNKLMSSVSSRLIKEQDALYQHFNRSDLCRKLIYKYIELRWIKIPDLIRKNTRSLRR